VKTDRSHALSTKADTNGAQDATEKTLPARRSAQAVEGARDRFRRAHHRSFPSAEKAAALTVTREDIDAIA
jgi:hypothetical protein